MIAVKARYEICVTCAAMTMRDTYGAALRMQAQFGHQEALFVAAERLDRCRAKGDAEGAAYWRYIRDAIASFGVYESPTVH